MNNGFVFKKSLGQNFLRDNNVIHKIVDSANIDKDTLVVEIGPGGGAITKKIVPVCGRAILYETDTRLEKNLNDLLTGCYNYSLIMDDFLKRDLKDDLNQYSFSKMYVVANLPYYITTPIIMKFIDEDVLPDRIVIMIQKEVAERFCANVGSRDYGSLTVFLNYYYHIKKLFDVSRNCFVPKPNVDSTVIMMDLKKDRFDIDDIDFNTNGIRIHRKGGNESIVYFGEEVQEALKAYLSQRNLIVANTGHEEALFLSLQNRRITVRAVENLVKKYASNVTTLKKITPHKLRSTFGTNLYNETGDIYLVADVLGHKDVNTTRKHYAAQSDANRRHAAKMVHLRDNEKEE